MDLLTVKMNQMSQVWQFAAKLKVFLKIIKKYAVMIEIFTYKIHLNVVNTMDFTNL